MSASKQMGDFFVREMGPDDLDSVAALEQVASAHPWRKTLFHSCFEAGYHCFVGCLEEVTIGFGILSVAAREAHLQNIAISPDYQGSGFGRELLSILIETADDLDVRAIYLEVSVENSNAYGLYLSAGFREVGIRKNYYVTANGRRDARVMKLILGAPRGKEVLIEMLRKTD